MISRTTYQILPQPDDSTCGPTALHSVYQHFNDAPPLSQVIDEVERIPGGGTYGAHLGSHALRRGYKARLFTFNLQLFDPTWFTTPGVDLADKLRRQAAVKPHPTLRQATESMLNYLALGGQIFYQQLTRDLLRRHLLADHPVLTGLSATYLYSCARELGEHKLYYDDIAGEPQGHFVVLYDYDSQTREVLVADPLANNPAFHGPLYRVHIDRVIAAMLLGILTYDGNLLILEPPRTPKKQATP